MKLTFELLVEFVKRVNQDEFGNSDSCLPELNSPRWRNQPRIGSQKRDALLQDFIDNPSGITDGLPSELRWPTREGYWLTDLCNYVDLVKLREVVEKGEVSGRGILLIPEGRNRWRGSPSQEELDSRAKAALKSIVHPVAQFPSPPDLHWEEVSMAFVSDKEIKVRARGQLKKYKFHQIGFEDKRNGKPNRLWLFLRAFAATGGRLSWQDLGRTGMNENQVQSNVKRLRKVLRRFMGIDDDPFESYKKAKAYEIKFTISGDASTLTDSHDDTSKSDLETVYEAEIDRSR